MGKVLVMGEREASSFYQHPSLSSMSWNPRPGSLLTCLILMQDHFTSPSLSDHKLSRFGHVWPHRFFSSYFSKYIIWWASNPFESFTFSSRIKTIQADHNRKIIQCPRISLPGSQTRTVYIGIFTDTQRLCQGGTEAYTAFSNWL